jgi:hypothetical protein
MVNVDDSKPYHGVPLSEDLQREALELLSKGRSIREVARTVGISKTTALKIKHRGIVKPIPVHPATPAVPAIAATKKDVKAATLDKIIDLAGERLIKKLEDPKDLGPVALNVIYGTAWDKKHRNEANAKPVTANLMANLFGSSALEVARSLVVEVMTILPTQHREPAGK